MYLLVARKNNQLNRHVTIGLLTEDVVSRYLLAWFPSLTIALSLATETVVNMRGGSTQSDVSGNGYRVIVFRLRGGEQWADHVETATTNKPAGRRLRIPPRSDQ